LPERKGWSKRNTHGPTLRQHELDVLAFLKARLKAGNRRSAENRRRAEAAIAEDSSAEPTEQPGQKPELEPTGS